MTPMIGSPPPVPKHELLPWEKDYDGDWIADGGLVTWERSREDFQATIHLRRPIPIAILAHELAHVVLRAMYGRRYGVHGKAHEETTRRLYEALDRGGDNG